MKRRKGTAFVTTLTTILFVTAACQPAERKLPPEAEPAPVIDPRPEPVPEDIGAPHPDTMPPVPPPLPDTIPAGAGVGEAELRLV